MDGAPVSLAHWDCCKHHSQASPDTRSSHSRTLHTLTLLTRRNTRLSSHKARACPSTMYSLVYFLISRCLLERAGVPRDSVATSLARTCRCVECSPCYSLWSGLPSHTPLTQHLYKSVGTADARILVGEGVGVGVGVGVGDPE